MDGISTGITARFVIIDGSIKRKIIDVNIFVVPGSSQVSTVLSLESMNDAMTIRH